MCCQLTGYGKVAALSDYSLQDLLYLMERLRDPVDGCPWDRKQDFSTIVPHTLEEAYELADAIASGDDQHIKEELGDVLFQVVFYAQLAKEGQQFSFADIVDTLVEKLLRRHPHVFPEGELTSRYGKQTRDMESIKQNWESIKAAERQGKRKEGVLDDIPTALPALSRAAKLQKRVSAVGFDWDETYQVLAHLKSELDELMDALKAHDHSHVEEEMGDVLFCAVNLSRHLKVEPETALRGANLKFEKRFRYIEQALSDQGCSLEEATLEQMDALWLEAKEQGL